MPEVDRFLGEVAARLEGIEGGLSVMRQEFTDSRDKDCEARGRMYAKLEEYGRETLSVRGRLASHIEEDNRRFSVLWRVLLASAGGCAAIYGAIRALT